MSEPSSGGLSFSFLTPEYRRNVFFIYERKLRVFSPPEKVFDYFSSVKSRDGTFMTSLDLMRAAVPVFQPVDSNHIRSGFLGGEHRDEEEDESHHSNPKSDFFKLFDTDGDGLISFPEYVFFTTLLSLPESQVKSTFEQFDADGSGGLCRGEFIEMMKVMRRSTSRGNATGLRTGLKATNVDDLSGGLVHYLFGEPGSKSEHKLSLAQFSDFLHRLRTEIDELEFYHYDMNNTGSISVQDFGYSVVANANVARMSYFIDRVAKLGSSSLASTTNQPEKGGGEEAAGGGRGWMRKKKAVAAAEESGEKEQRVTKAQFLAFCKLLKHGGTTFQAKMKNHVSAGGVLSKELFLKMAKECGATLSETQVDVLFFIFDVDGDGKLSPEEILDVVCRCRDDH